MEFKGALVIVGLALVICTVQGFPRDSSVLKTEEITQIQDQSKAAKDQFVEVSTTADKNGLPEDSSALKTEEITQVPDESKATKDQFVEVSTTTEKNEVKIPKGLPFVEVKNPGPVRCQFEEATEVLDCQEHCLPKGYSYGLCVGYKCSCI